MTTDTTTPAPVPLPDALTTWMIHPEALPIMMKFRDDLCDLGIAFIAAGATADMVTGGMRAVIRLIETNELDFVNSLPIDYPQPPYPVVAAPSGAPYTPPPADPAPTPAPVAPTPAPAPPVAVPEPSPEPVTPSPDWIDAAGQTYADWLASVAEAQQLAANLGTAYTPGPVPVFTAPVVAG